MSTLSDFLSRMKLALASGTQFGGARDMYEVFGWNRNVTHKDFVFKYYRQEIASRIIDAPVHAVWTDPPILKVGKKTWLEWDKFAKDVQVFPALSKLDRFAGLGMFSVLLIGLDDGKKLDQPVSKSRKNNVIFLQPYLEGSVKIAAYDENTSSPRYNKPIMYEIDNSLQSQDRPGVMAVTSKLPRNQKMQVHYSRILHVADGEMENTLFGRSRLQAVYNNLDDLQKITGGSAETYWMAANRGMHIDVDKEMELQPEDEEALTEEIDEYQHQLRRVLRTRGVKINSLGSDVADPKSSFGVQLALISSNTGIPQRVLMGAEAGQLASQQDRANWAVVVDQRIAYFAEPIILRPFINKLGEINVLNVPDYTIEWPETFKMNPLERAQASAQMARSAVNVIRAMKEAQDIGTELVSIEEAREIIAPGARVPVLIGTPTGKTPPSIDEMLKRKAEAVPLPESNEPPATPGTSTKEPPPKNPDDSRPLDTRGKNA